MDIKSCFIIAGSFVGFLFCDNLDDKSKYMKNKKESFLDKIIVDDHEIMEEINKLKRDFYSEKVGIKDKYDKRIHRIKENRKEELVSLRKMYRKRLKQLRKKYPDIPQLPPEGIDDFKKKKSKPIRKDKKIDKERKNFNERNKVKESLDNK